MCCTERIAYRRRITVQLWMGGLSLGLWLCYSLHSIGRLLLHAHRVCSAILRVWQLYAPCVSTIEVQHLQAMAMMSFRLLFQQLLTGKLLNLQLVLSTSSQVPLLHPLGTRPSTHPKHAGHIALM